MVTGKRWPGERKPYGDDNSKAVANRYEKTACSYMGVLTLAAAMDWIRR